MEESVLPLPSSVWIFEVWADSVRDTAKEVFLGALSALGSAPRILRAAYQTNGALDYLNAGLKRLYSKENDNDRLTQE